MGGRAFSNVVPVPKSKVLELIDTGIKIVGYPWYGILGSTGKKPFSGDIDIAVSQTDITYDRLVDLLTSKLGVENVNTHGRNLNQVYTRFIAQDGSGPYQVDFMLGDVPLLEFTHWSPDPNNSNYTGSHRTELIKAVAKVISPYQVFSGDRMVARIGYTLYHDRGLVYSTRWCPPRKDGRGFTTKMVELQINEFDQFEELFPSIKPAQSTATISPSQICCELFGHTAHRVLNSYEQVAATIMGSTRLCGHRDMIWQLYTKRLDEIKLPHPERLI